MSLQELRPSDKHGPCRKISVLCAVSSVRYKVLYMYMYMLRRTTNKCAGLWFSFQTDKSMLIA